MLSSHLGAGVTLRVLGSSLGAWGLPGHPARLKYLMWVLGSPLGAQLVSGCQAHPWVLRSHLWVLDSLFSARLAPGCSSAPWVLGTTATHWYPMWLAPTPPPSPRVPVGATTTPPHPHWQHPGTHGRCAPTAPSGPRAGSLGTWILPHAHLLAPGSIASKAVAWPRPCAGRVNV